MNKRTACKINGFKYPASDQISGRTSTICRSMACTLLKREGCSPEEESKWMQFFPEKKCAYCGKPASHLDHLYALIVDRRPTGYGTEPANLVPCCTSCNQPKGNLHWRKFMESEMCKHIGDDVIINPLEARDKRIKVLEEFEEKMNLKAVVIDEGIMESWNEMLHRFDAALKDAQNELEKIKEKLYENN